MEKDGSGESDTDAGDYFYDDERIEEIDAHMRNDPRFDALEAHLLSELDATAGAPAQRQRELLLSRALRDPLTDTNAVHAMSAVVFLAWSLVSGLGSAAIERAQFNKAVVRRIVRRIHATVAHVQYNTVANVSMVPARYRDIFSTLVAGHTLSGKSGLRPQNPPSLWDALANGANVFAPRATCVHAALYVHVLFMWINRGRRQWTHLCVDTQSLWLQSRAPEPTTAVCGRENAARARLVSARALVYAPMLGPVFEPYAAHVLAPAWAYDGVHATAIGLRAALCYFLGGDCYTRVLTGTDAVASAIAAVEDVFHPLSHRSAASDEPLSMSEKRARHIMQRIISTRCLDALVYANIVQRRLAGKRSDMSVVGPALAATAAADASQSADGVIIRVQTLHAWLQESLCETPGDMPFFGVAIGGVVGARDFSYADGQVFFEMLLGKSRVYGTSDAVLAVEGVLNVMIARNDMPWIDADFTAMVVSAALVLTETARTLFDFCAIRPTRWFTAHSALVLFMDRARDRYTYVGDDADLCVYVLKTTRIKIDAAYVAISRRAKKHYVALEGGRGCMLLRPSATQPAPGAAHNVLL